MRIAVIPARGGSKRIPRKNIQPFAGMPMIAHSLRAAHAAGLFEHVLVSSEDDEILTIAAEHGGEPIRRPPELAGDTTGTFPVIRHAIGWARAQGWALDAVCCIYATAPFLRPEDLRAAWECLSASGLDFSFAATTYPYPVFRSLVRDGDGVRMLFPEYLQCRSQDLPEAIHDAGQFYWGRPSAWLEREALFGPSAVPVMLPRHRVQDIDTPEDWRHAELLWQLLEGRAGADGA